MKSKQEFVDRWSDEILSLLLRSFAAEEMHGHKLNEAERGRFFRQSVAKAGDLVRSMYDYLAEQSLPPKPPEANGKPAFQATQTNGAKK